MKKLMLSALGAAALGLVACGGEARLRELDDAPAAEHPAPPERPIPPEGQPRLSAELRLRGDNPAGYSAVLVHVRRVSVTTVDGAPLEVRLEARHALDLTVPDHAHLLGRFQVPEGVDRVWVEVELDDFGGFEDGAGGGVIDTRVAPLRFEAPVDSLAHHGHAVVHLDLGRSLRASGEGRLLLPTLQVRF